jgi:hypothetical protein
MFYNNIIIQKSVVSDSYIDINNNIINKTEKDIIRNNVILRYNIYHYYKLLLSFISIIIGMLNSSNNIGNISLSIWIILFSIYTFVDIFIKFIYLKDIVNNKVDIYDYIYIKIFRTLNIICFSIVIIGNYLLFRYYNYSDNSLYILYLIGFILLQYYIYIFTLLLYYFIKYTINPHLELCLISDLIKLKNFDNIHFVPHIIEPNKSNICSICNCVINKNQLVNNSNNYQIYHKKCFQLYINARK